MTEYERVMNVLFGRGLPSEICGKVASLFEENEKLEEDNAELKKLLGLEKDWTHNTKGVVEDFATSLDRVKKENEYIKKELDRVDHINAEVCSENLKLKEDNQRMKRQLDSRGYTPVTGSTYREDYE